MTQSGFLKWYNPVKGYGFISPEEGDKDIFVHVSAFKKAGLYPVQEGVRITFETEIYNNKQVAINLAKSQSGNQ